MLQPQASSDVWGCNIFRQSNLRRPKPNNVASCDFFFQLGDIFQQFCFISTMHTLSTFTLRNEKGQRRPKYPLTSTDRCSPLFHHYFNCHRIIHSSKSILLQTTRDCFSISNFMSGLASILFDNEDTFKYNNHG